MTPQQHWDAMRDEIKAELARRRQEEFASLIALHGSMEAWHRACQRRRNADPDNRIARAVRNIIVNGRVNRFDAPILAADPQLVAYFASVTEAGPMAFMEERRRIIWLLEEAAKNADIHGNRYPVFDADAVKELLPTWRAWGQIIIDAAENLGAA